MFWECNSVSSSQLESLLEKESVGLAEILEQEDVIQECKNQNKKLIDFLCQPEMLKELINLVVLEPSAALDESERFKLPNIASEILTCENQALTLHIASEESLLQHLYTFVDQPPPLNPLLSSFFSKAFAALLVRKSDQDWYNYQVGYLKVFEFLKTKPVVKDFLRHIGTSSISDLILTLVTCGDDTTVRPMLLNWLDESRLVQSIIELLHPKFSRDTHDNASQLLIAIFPMAREEEYQTVTEKVEDPLLQTLEDPATVDLLLEVMFTPHPETETYCESSIINGITILLSLLKARNTKSTESTTALGFSAATYHAGTAVPDSEVTTPEEAARQKRILVATINSILPKLPDFTDLLINPPPKNAMNTTAGPLDPPLGATRLSVAKLVSALIETNHRDVHLKLIECKTIDILLDLFFKYSLNNFLHSHVEQCIKKVFSFKPISIQEEADETKTLSQTASEENPTQETPDESKPEEETETKEEDTPPDPGPKTPEGQENATESKAEETEDTMDTTVPLEDGPLDSTGESDSPAKPYENPLLDHLIAQCHLVEKILKGFELNSEEEAKRKQAYMGHLLTIANSLVELLDKSECSEFIRNVMNSCEDTSSNWDSFVKEKLVEFNERNKIVHRYNYSNSMNSLDEDGFKDMQFAQDNTQQANFSNYQMQEMSEHFFDSFGINNEEFNNDSDPSALANAKNITNISFGLDDDTGDDSAKEMFDAVCNQRVGKLPPMSGDDIDDSEDMWENKTREINFATNIEPIPKQSVTQINSSDEEDRDEDDDDDDEDTNDDEANTRSNSSKSSSEKKMDIDNAWPTPDEVEDVPSAMSHTTTSMETGNPWDSVGNPTTTSPVKSPPTVSPVAETGWADFDNNLTTTATSTDDSNTGSAPSQDESS